MTGPQPPRAGDVVYLTFDFLDGTGSKQRPAVVLSHRQYNQDHGRFIFAPLTGSAGSVSGVVEIADLGSAGLNRRTYAHGVVFTAQNLDVRRTTGRLSSGDLNSLKQLLRSILQL